MSAGAPQAEPEKEFGTTLKLMKMFAKLNLTSSKENPDREQVGIVAIAQRRLTQAVNFINNINNENDTQSTFNILKGNYDQLEKNKEKLKDYWNTINERVSKVVTQFNALTSARTALGQDIKKSEEEMSEAIKTGNKSKISDLLRGFSEINKKMDALQKEEEKVSTEIRDVNPKLFVALQTQVKDSKPLALPEEKVKPESKPAPE